MSKRAARIPRDSGQEPIDRKERLRLTLPAAVEALRARQASLIDAREIEDYVALNWLEWQGGTLKLTVTGANVCSQVAATTRKP